MKFLIELENNRTSWKNLTKSSDDRHTLAHDELHKDIFEDELGKKRRRGRPRLEYFPQIDKNMVCGVF